MNNDIEKAAGMIIESRCLIAFSGAGLSMESGIPTFRGDDGIWKNYSPFLYGNIPGLAFVFLFRFRRFRDFIHTALDAFAGAGPNPGHQSMARLEEMGYLKAAVTQNIDGLESGAGVKNVIELHGNLRRLRCSHCGNLTILSADTLRQAVRDVKRVRTKIGLMLAGLRYGRCPKCRRTARPDIVFFGESLPPVELKKAVLFARSSDLVLVLGTSGLVYPAASIPVEAVKTGARLIEINPEPSALTHMADIFIPEPSGQALPRIIDHIEKMRCKH